MAKQKPKESKEPKGSWIVRMTVNRTVDVYCEECTEAEAWERPWDFAVDEADKDQTDWEVLDVTPNE